MRPKLLDRVMANRLEKFRKIFDLFAAITAVAGVIVTLWIAFVPFLKTAQFWFDYAALLAMPLLYTIAMRVMLRYSSSQKIEWWTNQIVFKAGTDGAQQAIALDQITSIDLTNELITVYLKTGRTYYINLGSFTGDKVRSRIEFNLQQTGLLHKPVVNADQLATIPVNNNQA
jgi:hypothetical protein